MLTPRAPLVALCDNCFEVCIGFVGLRGQERLVQTHWLRLGGVIHSQLLKMCCKTLASQTQSLRTGIVRLCSAFACGARRPAVHNRCLLLLPFSFLLLVLVFSCRCFMPPLYAAQPPLGCLRAAARFNVYSFAVRVAPFCFGTLLCPLLLGPVGGPAVRPSPAQRPPRRPPASLLRLVLPSVSFVCLSVCRS